MTVAICGLSLKSFPSVSLVSMVVGKVDSVIKDKSNINSQHSLAVWLCGLFIKVKYKVCSLRNRHHCMFNITFISVMAGTLDTINHTLKIV